MAQCDTVVTELAQVSAVLRRASSMADIQATRISMVATMVLKIKSIQSLAHDDEMKLLDAIAASPFTDEQKSTLTSTVTNRVLAHITGAASETFTELKCEFAHPHTYFTAADWRDFNDPVKSQSLRISTMASRLVVRLGARYIREKDFRGLARVLLNGRAEVMSEKAKKELVDDIKDAVKTLRSRCHYELPIRKVFPASPSELEPPHFAFAYPDPNDPPIAVTLDDRTDVSLRWGSKRLRMTRKTTDELADPELQPSAAHVHEMRAMHAQMQRMQMQMQMQHTRENVDIPLTFLPPSGRSRWPQLCDRLADTGPGDRQQADASPGGSQLAVMGTGAAQRANASLSGTCRAGSGSQELASVGVGGPNSPSGVQVLFFRLGSSMSWHHSFPMCLLSVLFHSPLSHLSPPSHPWSLLYPFASPHPLDRPLSSLCALIP